MAATTKRREGLLAGEEHECPTCKGSGKYRGPIPWPNCLRCGGYGTILLAHADEEKDG